MHQPIFVKLRLRVHTVTPQALIFIEIDFPLRQNIEKVAKIHVEYQVIEDLSLIHIYGEMRLVFKRRDIKSERLIAIHMSKLYL